MGYQHEWANKKRKDITAMDVDGFAALNDIKNICLQYMEDGVHGKKLSLKQRHNIKLMRILAIQLDNL